MLRSRPHLRRNLKHCRHCGIFFFTEPSNVKRKDLRCPFGCSGAHRLQCARHRSVEYYRDPKGRDKKRALNRRRYLISSAKASQSEAVAVAVPGVEAAPILEHVRMVTSLIEGREVSLKEIKEMLKRKSRQHSLTRQRRIDYFIQQLNKGPPKG